MLFITPEDFFQKTSQLPRIDRQTELDCAKKMLTGDHQARETIIRGYLPFVAAVLRRKSPDLHTLRLILSCCTALEKAVDNFDFLQDSEPFSHRLSWYLRQTVTYYIASR